MAFTKTNLRVLEDGTIGALATGKLWKYVKPTDDDVTAAGYFTSDTGLKAGDIVLVIDGTSYGFYVLSGTVSLTVTQMSENS